MGISMKELKNNRLTPAEKWVLEQIEGVERTTYSRFSKDDIICWVKNCNFMFEQNFDDGKLTVSNLEIWSELVFCYGLKDNEIKELLTNLLYDYTDNGKLKIDYYQYFITILTKNIKIIFKKTLKNNFLTIYICNKRKYVK